MNVPEGWQLVPIEPTREMCEVYKRFHNEGKFYLEITIWKAMLAAAPQPPKTTPGLVFDDGTTSPSDAMQRLADIGYATEGIQRLNGGGFIAINEVR